jgi:thioredoxin reductase (NADPH)
MENNKILDLLILGGGPAGVTSAIYASRGSLDCLILDTATIGGQLNWTQAIENYPGYPTINGYELIEKFQEQLNKLNVEVKSFQGIQSVDLTSNIKVVETLEGTYKAKTIILCTGANPKKLGVKGEAEFIGRGVSYCAVCDGAFFKGKDIAVIGGGNSAVEEAIYLTRFASSVTIIHRRDELRANKLYQKRAMENPKMKFIWDSVIEEIIGDVKGVNKIILKNLKTNEISELNTSGVFPYVGTSPNTPLFKNQINLDESGYILCNNDMSTNVPGVFTAGDVRKTTLRQIVVSASDGAIAATSAIKYLDEILQENTITA